MGKLDADPVIHHFSHQHPLKLLNFQSQTMKTDICAGCKREVSGWIYSCSACNYNLHKPCSNMPQTLSHMANTKHALILLSSPAYPEGAFKCNACGGLGTSFGYHCRECELDIHTICAFMPSSIKHNGHDHPLNLCFNSPYNGKGFLCDICRETSSNHWLYRCDSCEFDAHMKCAKANTQGQQPQLVKPRSVPSQILKPLTNHHFLAPTVQHTGFPCIQTQYPIPGNGFSNGFQPFPQVNHYTVAPISVPPQYGQPQPARNNNIVKCCNWAFD